MCLNRLMTAGQDQRWRRYVVTRAQIPNNATVLDLASGTGDIAFEVLKRHPEAQVTAGDFSLGMMHKGRTRKMGDQVDWVGCDAMALPCEDGSFDAAVSTQVYEYVPDMKSALAELHRVLVPGGRVFILDTDWIVPGELDFRAVVIAGDPTLANDVDPWNNFIETSVEFHQAAPVNVHMYPLYLTEDGTSDGPGEVMIHTAGDG